MVDKDKVTSEVLYSSGGGDSFDDPALIQERQARSVSVLSEAVGVIREIVFKDVASSSSTSTSSSSITSTGAATGTLQELPALGVAPDGSVLGLQNAWEAVALEFRATVENFESSSSNLLGTTMQIK